MLAVLEPGKKRRRFARLLDFAADSVGWLIGWTVIVATAAVPVVYAIRSGKWWLILLAVVIVGGGAVAMIAAAQD